MSICKRLENIQEKYKLSSIGEYRQMIRKTDTMKKTYRHKSLRIFAFLGFLFAAILIPSIQANAVFVSPVLVIFEKHNRTARITINNRSKQTKVVTFDWQHRAMKPDGKIVKLKEGETSPGYRPADPYIKFSPRRVVLKPLQHQKIRLLVQRPADMEPGEYRSDLLIKEENYKEAERNVSAGKQKGISGEINFQVYKSIPVFIRHGDTHVNVKLQSAALITKDNKPHIHIELTNDSTRSLYGQIHLECQTASGEVIDEKFIMLRIYAEAKNIKHDVKLFDRMDVSRCTSLKTKIIGRNDAEYAGKILSEINTTLN